MTSSRQDSIGTDLAVALRERAADVGGEEALLRAILAGAAMSPQRRRLAPWSDHVGRRTVVVLAAALLATAVVAAGLGAGMDAPPTPAQFPTLRNGPILVGRDGRTWWIDPATGARLTAPDLPDLPEGTDAAAWSRDGRQLAIVVRGDLELVDLATGDRRVVATCVELVWGCELDTGWTRPFDWSPDGITIAFTSHQGLGTVDVRTGHLTTIIDDGGSYWSPTWSPDGRAIAFEYDVPYRGRYVGALREIQSIAPDGSDRRRLSGSPEPESIGFASPIWSPDGTRIVYLGSDPWDQVTGWALRAMAIDLVDGTPAGSPVSLVDLGTAYCLGTCPSVTLSPDGRSVLVDIDDELQVVPIDGTEGRTLSVNARPMAWRPIP